MISNQHLLTLSERAHSSCYGNTERERISMLRFFRLSLQPPFIYPNGIAWFGDGEGIDKVPGYGEKADRNS